jgi:hypothetical protein
VPVFQWFALKRQQPAAPKAPCGCEKYAALGETVVLLKHLKGKESGFQDVKWLKTSFPKNAR